MPEGKIFIVDDDEAVRDGLAMLLDANGFDAEQFGSAEAFLEGYSGSEPGCLLVDMRMPGMSGLQLLGALKARSAPVRVVVISGYGDIPSAVGAMKAGAIDFLEKPYTGEAILDCVRRALQHDAGSPRPVSPASMARLARLTDREREVYELLIAGLPNKAIAQKLDLSPRTVEVHRARVFDKMECRNLAELIRVALTSGPSST